MFHSVEENTFSKSKANTFKEHSSSANKLVTNEGLKSKGSVVLVKSHDKESIKFLKGNLKILKNEASSSKDISDYNKDKLTFDSVFSKNFTTSATVQSPIVPINININNININNYNINNVIRKSNTSGINLNSSNKFMSFKFNPSSSIQQSNNVNIESFNSSKNILKENNNSSITNFKHSNLESFPLPKISCSNHDLNINQSNSLKKKIISHKIGVKNTPLIYMKKMETEHCNTDRAVNNKEINDNKYINKIVENNVENSNKKPLKKKVNYTFKQLATIMGADDQNDSLINELADFLNGTSEKKQHINDNTNVDQVENDNNNSLNRAVVINDNEESISEKQKEYKSQKIPNKFREITEKQILQSTQDINNKSQAEEVDKFFKYRKNKVLQSISNTCNK
jgi:hypothetical protein